MRPPVRRTLVIAGALAWAAIGACSNFEASDPAPADAGPEGAATADGAPGQVDGPTDAGADASASSAYRTAVISAGPVVYWRMGHVATGVIADEMGSGNSLVLQGGGHAIGAPGAIEGDPDTAIGFDGAKSFAIASLPRLLDFPAGVPFTFECWARRDDVDGGGFFKMLVATTEGDRPDSNGYALYAVPIIPDRPPFTSGEVATDTAEVAANGPLVPAGAWAHYAFVYSGKAVNLYINGTLTGSSAVTGSIEPRKVIPFTIARDARDSKYFWPGAIDEIALYPKALTVAEILHHHTLGASAPADAGGD